MMPTPHVAWWIRRLVSMDEPGDGELPALPEPYALLAHMLVSTPFAERGGILDAYLASCDHRDALERLMDDTDPRRPPPAPNTDTPPAAGTLRRNGVRDDEAQDDPLIALPEWPAPLGEAAYVGLAGEIVRTIEPETEADPVALLVQMLIAFGSAVGRGPHVRVGGARHHAHEYGVMVGETSAGRKGTSWSDTRQCVARADPEWYGTRVMGGLSSGEGLIYHVRDPVEGREPLREKGKIVGYQDVTLDHGVTDKRLLIVETEFGAVLRALQRDGNKLSATLRQAWDGDPLASLTKGSPYRATGAHVSLIGHITADELTRLLSACDQANGLANRILWCCVRRVRLLPFGGRAAQQDVDRLAARVADAIAFARGVDAAGWTRDAMDLWVTAYPRLTAPRPGVLGMVTSRAEAHVVRLALHYTLIDRSGRIETDHLRAALALWDYCQRSAAYIFGAGTGDRDADTILAALRATPDGMSRHEIRRGLFSGNRSAESIASTMAALLRLGLVRSETVQTGGRPAERWHAVELRPNAKDAENAESPRRGTDPYGANGVNGVTASAERVIPGGEVTDS